MCRAMFRKFWIAIFCRPQNLPTCILEVSDSVAICLYTYVKINQEHGTMILVGIALVTFRD